MISLRLRLAHSGLVLGALLVLGCGASHSVDDAGPDASPVDASGVDASYTDAALDAILIDGGADATTDAGVRDLCDPEDARVEFCPASLCDGPSSWHWDGDHCFEADCGTCRGSDCDAGAVSLAECQAAHASCDVSLCRDTGGTWAWWRPVCGPYRCGVAPPADCEVASPGCGCGSSGQFVPGVGCQPDTACPELPPVPEETLCTSTGGAWSVGICCPTVCGVPCAAACAAPACDCGPTEIFDPDRGCEVGQRCVERLLGESCAADSRCEDGTICCDSCGGAGCAGTPTCKVPVCSDDPNIDSCGNNSLAA